MSLYFLSFFSVFLISLISLIGGITFLISDRLLRNLIPNLVAFSVGALFASVFLLLLPEAVLYTSKPLLGSALILLGLLSFFILEKAFSWQHSHQLPEQEIVKPLGLMNLFADGLHNFLDGIIIGVAFLASKEIGLIFTLAVIAHEIPQELGDYAILIYSGFSRWRALFFNYLSALPAFLGLFLSWFLVDYSEFITNLILPIAIGGFIYLAGTDLLPELHKTTNWQKTFYQILMMIMGAGIIFITTNIL